MMSYSSVVVIIFTTAVQTFRWHLYARWKNKKRTPSCCYDFICIEPVELIKNVVCSEWTWEIEKPAFVFLLGFRQLQQMMDRSTVLWYKTGRIAENWRIEQFNVSTVCLKLKDPTWHFGKVCRLADTLMTFRCWWPNVRCVYVYKTSYINFHIKKNWQ